MSTESVWIVQHDESPHNTVLGVFSTEDEAAAFAESAKSAFPNGLIYARYEIGYRYDRGTGHAVFADQ